MRKLLLFSLILLVSAAWAVAQNPTSPPMSEQPGAQQPGAQQPGAQPGMPGQAGQQPGMPGAQQPGVPGAQTGQTGQESSTAGNESTIEGCLGGSAGKFNITDKSGTSYQLQIPAGADTSKLNQHIGEEVRVTGTLNNSTESNPASASGGTQTGAGASSAAGGSGPSIAVSKIDKVADKCSTSTQGTSSQGPTTK